MIVLGIVAFALVVAGLITLNVVYTRRRRDALTVLASELGFEYSPKDPFDTMRLGFELFARRRTGVRRREVTDMLWGQFAGRPTTLFVFTEYVESSTTSRDSSGHSTTSTTTTAHPYVCAVMHLAAGFPGITISPEHFKLFGRGRDLQFESDAFNHAFEVRTDEAKAAYDLIDARMVRWLLETGKKRTGSFEVLGPYVLRYARGRKPEELREGMMLLGEFVARIPDVALRLHPAR